MNNYANFKNKQDRVTANAAVIKGLIFQKEQPNNGYSSAKLHILCISLLISIV